MYVCVVSRLLVSLCCTYREGGGTPFVLCIHIHYAHVHMYTYKHTDIEYLDEYVPCGIAQEKKRLL